MQIKTKAGQIISFEQNIADFGWKLYIRVDGEEIVLDLTDEEMRWIKLDINHRVK